MTYGEAAQIANDNIGKINVGGNTNYHRIIGFTRDRGDSLKVENNIAKWNTGEHARQESHGIG